MTRLIPNLLALNERVVLNGEWEQVRECDESYLY